MRSTDKRQIVQAAAARLAVLDGKSGHAGLDRKRHIGGHAFGLGREAVFEVGIDGQIHRGAKFGRWLQHIIARHGIVGPSPGPGMARAGRGQGGKSQMLQQPRAAHVPGIGDHKTALLVQGAETGALDRYRSCEPPIAPMVALLGVPASGRLARQPCTGCRFWRRFLATGRRAC